MGIFGSLKRLFGGKKGPPLTTKALQRIDVEKRFELMGRTGQGSMSKVWRARDRKLGRIVCLKVLDKEKTLKFEARFHGLNRPPEASICLMLKHKNVVQTLDVGMSARGEQCLVMEFVDGMGLNFLIETKSAQLNGHRVDYLIQLADGLEYVHKSGFLHRDICPRNIMVTSQGVVKYIDFGLAIPFTPAFCKPGNRTGTPNYLAPEVIKRVETDQRVDMFALGVTAYEVFTGTLPWEKAQSMQTLLSHLNSPGKDPSELRPDLDAPTRQFLIKCIERNMKDRFQNPAEFRDALKALPKQDW